MHTILHGIADSRIGAIRIFACGESYLRNRPGNRLVGKLLGWKGMSMVAESRVHSLVEG